MAALQPTVMVNKLNTEGLTLKQLWDHVDTEPLLPEPNSTAQRARALRCLGRAVAYVMHLAENVPTEVGEGAQTVAALRYMQELEEEVGAYKYLVQNGMEESLLELPNGEQQPAGN